MANDDASSPPADLHPAEIRALAQRFNPDECEICMREQLEEGASVCEPSAKIEEIAGVPAKAEFVKARMAQGATLVEAMRELGRWIRAFQQRGGT